METVVALKKENKKSVEKIPFSFGRKTVSLLSYLLLPIIIFVLWWYVGNAHIFPAIILPSVDRVWNSFLSQIQSGQLVSDVLISLGRVLKGFFLAALFGIGIGVIMGISPRSYRFLILTFNGVRQIPMLAWMPLIILWFGIDETSKVVIIVLGAFFPVLVNTISGIKSIPNNYIEVGKMFQLSHLEMFTKVYLPSIFIGLKLALGFSWMIVVAAELISATSGIGYRMNDARSLMMPEVVIVGMLVIGAIGLIMDQLLVRFGQWLMPWYQVKK